MKLQIYQSQAGRVQRPISFKIFGITLVLLVLMGIVSCSATSSMRRVNEQLSLLSDYYIPLDQLGSQVRTHNLQQILAFERIQEEKPAASFDEVSKTVASHAEELADCDDERQSAVSAKLREIFPDRSVRRMASYEVHRLCGDLKMTQARQLASQALNLPFVARDPVLVGKLTRLQTELGQVPQTRASMYAIARRYLIDAQGGRANAQTLQLLQEQLDAQRRLFNRQARSIVQLLNEDTNVVAATVHQLERRAFWFNWGVTLLAMLLGTICAWLLTRNLVRPVRRLLQGAQAIEQGNLDVRLEVDSADEIAQLTRSFNHMVNGLKEKEVIKETFGRYVDPRIVSNLIGGESTAALEASKRPMTVLFSDIEGFTAMCEQLTPDRVVNLLNAYLTEMSQPIRASHGIIDKYVGDAIMAFWGPPFVGETQHAVLACHAALEQQERLEGFRRRIPDLVGLRHGLARFNVRIGISTGEVTVGNIGSETAKSYTVIGDTTNLASRLESVNKQFGTRIIISHDTWVQAQADVEVRELDAIRVVGKREPVRIYELLARAGALSTPQRQLRDRFAQGLDAYRQRNWPAAREAFSACLALEPEDGPSRLFLKRLDSLEAQAPGPDWDGVWNLVEK
jgi:adenylate cyclase